MNADSGSVCPHVRHPAIARLCRTEEGGTGGRMLLPCQLVSARILYSRNTGDKRSTAAFCPFWQRLLWDYVLFDFRLAGLLLTHLASRRKSQQSLGWYFGKVFCLVGIVPPPSPPKNSTLFLPLPFSFSISFFNANHRVRKERNGEIFGSSYKLNPFAKSISASSISTSTWRDQHED